MHFDQAIQQLKGDLNLSELDPDPDGHYSVIIDGNLEVDISKSKDNAETMLLNGVVGLLPAEEKAKEAKLKELLKVNLARIKLGKQSIMLDPEDGATLSLHQKLNLHSLDGIGFSKSFESFVNNLEFWQQFAQDNPQQSSPVTPFIIHP